MVQLGTNARLKICKHNAFVATMASSRTTCDMCQYYHHLNFELEQTNIVHDRFIELHSSILYFLIVVASFTSLPWLPFAKNEQPQWSPHQHLSPIYYLNAPRFSVFSTLNLANKHLWNLTPQKKIPRVLCHHPHRFPRHHHTFLMAASSRAAWPSKTWRKNQNDGWISPYHLTTRP